MIHCPGIWSSIEEFEAVPRNLTHCPWIGDIVPKLEVLSLNFRQCTGICNSVSKCEAVSWNLKQFPLIQESEAVSSYLKQCPWVWGSVPEFEEFSQNLRLNLRILGTVLQFEMCPRILGPFMEVSPKGCGNLKNLRHFSVSIDKDSKVRTQNQKKVLNRESRGAVRTSHSAQFDSLQRTLFLCNEL